jgi:hypothetical protein
VNLKNRLAAIDVNLDDLQSGIEAGSRTAHTLRADTTKLNGLRTDPVIRNVVRHVEDLQACVRDQRAAMQELRDGVTRLQKDLQRANRPSDGHRSRVSERGVEGLPE